MVGKSCRPYPVKATVVIFLSLLYVVVGVTQLDGASLLTGSGSHQSQKAETCNVTVLKDGDYYPALLRTIDNAKHEIVMSFFLFKTNGYRSNYPDKLLHGLIEAAKRGVSVSVILEIGHDAKSRVNRDNRATAGRLKNNGVTVYFDSPRATTHTKVVIVDKRYTFIGSHNLTASALKYNHEVSVLIDSSKIAEDMLRYSKMLYR
jgi:phosphatidylserine/phosphatidylglycerophosphate/cardiolipin synthase-like enzyme